MPLRGPLARHNLHRISLAVALCIGCASSVAAHPHVWATVRSEIVFGPDHRITGIRHAWTFDEFYTAMAVQGLDTDGDGVYSKEELDPLAKVNVESLKEFAYFTFVRLGKSEKPLPLKEPVDYSIDYDKTLLTLHFTLPLETPLDPKTEEVAVDVYDPSFFVAFGFATDAPVKLSGVAGPGLRGGNPKARSRERCRDQGSERSLLQPAWARLEFRVTIRTDGNRQMPDTLRRAVHRSAAVLALGLLLLAVAVPASAEPSPPAPFFSAGASAQGGPLSAFSPPQAAPRAQGMFGSLMSWVAETQQRMQRELAASVKRLKSGNAIAAALALAGLSFLYGVVHAVGPGHGKAIISSYVVANEETVRRGVLISFLAAGLQAVTAVVLVGVLLIALNATGLQVNAWVNQLESVSYALIALVGLYLLSTQLLRLWRRYRGSNALEPVASHAGHVHGTPGHAHAT